VPHAPEFVAFERNSPVIQGNEARAATVAKSEDPVAVLIPSALSSRTSLSSSSSLVRVPRQPAVHAARQAVEHHVVNQLAGERRNTSPQVVAARWNINADRNAVDTAVESGVGSNDETIVPVETLLVVRTTQRVGQDSWLWSVCVWRITWTNPSQDAAGRGPVAKKT